MSTLEERLAILEQSYIALEAKYQNLLRDESTSKKSETETVEKITAGASNKDNVDDDEKTDAEKTETASKSARYKIQHRDPNNEIIGNDKKGISFTLDKWPHEDDELEIHDVELCKLLRTELSHEPTHEFLGDTAILISPWESIVLNWDKLEKVADSADTQEGTQAHSDLRDLLNVLVEHSGDRMDSFFKTRVKYREERKTTFEFLWTIFRPGDLIFGRPLPGQPQLFVVQDHGGLWPEKFRGRQSEPWRLKVWMFDWDGERFSRRYYVINFDKFEGSKPITSLPFYPLRYHDNVEEIRKVLKERGEKFRALCVAKKGEQMFYYKGPAFMGQRIAFHEDSVDDDDGSSIFGRRFPGYAGATKTFRSSEVAGHIMVDFLSYKRYGPIIFEMGQLFPIDSDQDCNCSQCLDNPALQSKTRKRYDDLSVDADWEEEQYMLCPPRVVGYVLREKQWAQLLVNSVQKSKSGSEDSFQKVKLATEGNKEFLLDLVRTHGRSDENGKYRIRDIVENKGNSLVILLYGPPGVGKTSTAETIAIAANKPLFSVGVSDAGTKAQHAEKNLDKIFDLAASWEAILLIDEADVFLERRSKGHASNTEKNALVSVFLRVLEYYQGILFLTTNQIAQFDVAVQSRIHIAMKYDQLNDEQTTAIFGQFLDQLDKNGQVKNVGDIKAWVKNTVIRKRYRFDGRQIRNIISCAMTLARARGGKLSKQDMNEVVDFVLDFKTEFQIQFDRYINSQRPSMNSSRG